jgi:hypothetical protein
MIVIATHNGKNNIEKLLTNLEELEIDDDVCIVDTGSSDKEHLEFLDEIKDINKFNLKLQIYHTQYRGFDSGAYIYAINNLVSDRYYFLHDSMIIKTIDYFKEIDKKLKPGIVVCLITFQSNFFANGEQTSFCISNFGTSVYNKGIFGPIFSILYEDAQKIDKSLLVYPYDKMTQMAMERGWSIIFEKYNLKIESLEGEKDDDKLYNDKYLYFTKFFPYRL